MTRNDGFYKFLFALELALLPMVVFANLYWAKWTMGLIIGAVCICNVWREIFKDRTSRQHSLIGLFASVMVFAFLLIYLTVLGYLNPVLASFGLAFIVLYNIFKEILFNKHINETISAVDFCFTIFESVALIAFGFVVMVTQPATIAVWTLLLTSAVSVAYKVYYLFRYEDLIGKIKNLFHKR